MRRADELAVQVLRRGYPLRIKTRGGSMLPFLRDGDVALVVPAARTEVGVGDVICYETSPGRLFVHRVIDRARDQFLAKGDALACVDVIDPPQLLRSEERRVGKEFGGRWVRALEKRKMCRFCSVLTRNHNVSPCAEHQC